MFEQSFLANIIACYLIKVEHINIKENFTFEVCVAILRAKLKILYTIYIN